MIYLKSDSKSNTLSSVVVGTFCKVSAKFASNVERLIWSSILSSIYLIYELKLLYRFFHHFLTPYVFITIKIQNCNFLFRIAQILCSWFKQSYSGYFNHVRLVKFIWTFYYSLYLPVVCLRRVQCGVIIWINSEELIKDKDR